MKIFLGADHRGFELKEEIKEWLEREEYEFEDMGALKFKPKDDYPDYAFAVAEKVVQDPVNNRGIVFCGSGAGIAIAANKVKGIRAAQARDPEIAAVSRADDNSNVLSIAADYIDTKTAIKVVIAWLRTDFSKEPRHIRRTKKIADYENA